LTPGPVKGVGRGVKTTGVAEGVKVAVGAAGVLVAVAGAGVALGDSDTGAKVGANVGSSGGLWQAVSAAKSASVTTQAIRTTIS